MPPPGRHPGESGHTVHECMETPPPAALGSHVESALELSCFVAGVVGPRGHALALTSGRRRDETRAPSLRPACPTGLQRYYEPLGLPPGTAPFRLRLIGAAFARRGRRGGSLLFRPRLSLRAVFPTPGVSCAPPVLARAVCCLRRDMTGSATPPFGADVTGLQSSLDVRPASLLPSRRPYGLRRALDAPLSPWESPPTPGACYAARRRAYRGGTCTR